MKNEKQKFQNQKKKLNMELQNEKYNLINKFNNLVKGKSKIDSEIVKQLYPEDEELYKKIKNMQNTYQLSSIQEEEKDKKDFSKDLKSDKRAKIYLKMKLKIVKIQI